jgi:hypothetical protein
MNDPSRYSPSPFTVKTPIVVSQDICICFGLYCRDWLYDEALTPRTKRVVGSTAKQSITDASWERCASRGVEASVERKAEPRQGAGRSCGCNYAPSRG